MKSRQGIAYRHVIMLALSLKFPKKYETTSSYLNCRKLSSSTTPLSFDAHSPKNPLECPHIPYISRNWDHLPTFLPLIAWVYLHSFFVVGSVNTCILKETVQDHPRSLTLVPIERT